MTKIFITGGSGFIGTHLIQTMLSTDADVSILNIDIQASKLSDSRLKTIIGNINSWEDLELLDLSGFDTCIHLAALCKEPGFLWEEYFETNYDGTNNVARLCEKWEIRSILFTSTMMVFRAGEVINKEEDKTAPDTAYGISKLLAEKQLETWAAKSEKNDLKIMRPAVVFGLNENGNFTRLYKSLKRGVFPFIGRSTTVKSNIYVKEVVGFIQFLLEQKTTSNVYNLAFPETYEMGRIVQTFKKVFGIKCLNPVLPYSFMLFISRFFVILNSLGFKNSIHPRRIQKLYYSTHIFPQRALDDNYHFKYTLESALEDWKSDAHPEDLY